MSDAIVRLFEAHAGHAIALEIDNACAFRWIVNTDSV